MLALRRLSVAQRAAINKPLAIGSQRGFARGKFFGGSGRRDSSGGDQEDDGRSGRRERNTKQLWDANGEDTSDQYGTFAVDEDEAELAVRGEEAPDDFLKGYSSNSPAGFGGSFGGSDHKAARDLFKEFLSDADGAEFVEEMYPLARAPFEWKVPKELMADKSWPDTSGTDMYTDLFNIPKASPQGKELEKIMQEFYRRVDHKPISAIKLPTLNVHIPEDHPDKEALELMKLSLENNGRIKMDDKEEIMTMLIDEIDWLRKDKTRLFKDQEA